MATHRFEWRTGAIGLGLVIPRGDPDLPAIFQTYLGGAKYVARGVKTQFYTAVQQWLAIRQGLQVDVRAQTRTQDACTRRRGQIMLIAMASMVAVGVGDDRAFDRLPWVDIEITGRAVQTFRTSDNKVHVVTQMERPVS